jgi:hypothetical protein
VFGAVIGNSTVGLPAAATTETGVYAPAALELTAMVEALSLPESATVHRVVAPGDNTVSLQAKPVTFAGPANEMEAFREAPL